MLIFFMVIAVTIPLVMLTLNKRAKVQATDQEKERIQGLVRQRLEAIAPKVGGSIVEGPALKTPRGLLTYSVSPSNQIDVTKFTVEKAQPHIVQVVPVEDAQAVLHLKSTKPVEIDPRYSVLASDEAHARAVVTGKLIDRMRQLDAAVNIRTRVLVSTKGITVLASRGFTGDALRAFHDGAADVVEAISQKPKA